MPETTQTDETAEVGENNGEDEEAAAEGAGEPQEDFINQPEEYEDTQPESMISLCYSCTQYETCHEKKATVTSCNAYKDRREVHKTDEHRYNEEQAKIDAETRKKLRDQQQEETMQQGPEEKKHEEIRLSTSRYKEITSGALSFLLLKKDGFKVGEEISLPEYAEGQKTGRTLEIKISYVMEDWAGLDDDYCIIGFQIMSYTPAAAVAADGAGQTTLLPGE